MDGRQADSNLIPAGRLHASCEVRTVKSTQTKMARDVSCLVAFEVHCKLSAKYWLLMYVSMSPGPKVFRVP